MFRSKPKPSSTSKERGNRGGGLSQFGLMDMPDVDDLGHMSVDDDKSDAAFEAELRALMTEGSKTKKPVPKKRAPPPVVDLDTMVAQCMRDVPSGDEDDDDFEGDPDLMNELEGLAQSDAEPEDEDEDEPPSPCASSMCAGQDWLSVIDARMRKYATAEKEARAASDEARARRFARGLATLTDLRRKLVTGKAISEKDIPPDITIAPKPSPAEDKVMDSRPTAAELKPPVVPEPTRNLVAAVASPVPSQKPVDDAAVSSVKTRRDECRAWALQAKKNGDKAAAVAGLKAVKDCDVIIGRLEAGETFHYELPSATPPAPSSIAPREEARRQGSSDQDASAEPMSRDAPVVPPADAGEDGPPLDPSVFGAPPPPASVAEALQQRLTKYRQDEQKAKAEGNDSRVRRLGRICKQYEDAVKMHKAGKMVPYADLPTPPGFAPIPIGVTPSSSSAQLSSPASASSLPPPSTSPASAASAASTAKAPSPNVATAKKPHSLRDKQLAVLEGRQNEFRAAALEAKKAGQTEQAKEYLRQFKGFDKLIEAAKGGLPVDLGSLPVPPQRVKDVMMDFEIISKEDCNPEALTGSRQDLYAKLEKELIEQVIMCERNRKHFKTTGDVATANKFHQMQEHTKKDLDALRYAFKRGDEVPKFHYEQRAFSKVICNTDLGDNDLEVTVLQGVNYSGAGSKEIQSYCKVEFPYPKEAPFHDKTAVKGSSNPEYNHKFVIPVNPKDKGYQRMFKRHNAKVEVWSKGGFLRSDTLMGTAAVKLLPLETQCEVHDVFPLMDGRRAVGGQVEVKIRLRNPVVAKQVEKVEEKWLVITFK